MSSITININKDDIEKMWDIKFTDEQWLKFVKEKQAQVSGSCFDWLRDEREYYIESDDEEEDEEDMAYCNVGEHKVNKIDMWEDFADCKNCVSKKEYDEQMNSEEED